jgi:hypothetical protein
LYIGFECSRRAAFGFLFLRLSQPRGQTCPFPFPTCRIYIVYEHFLIACISKEYLTVTRPSHPLVNMSVEAVFSQQHAIYKNRSRPDLLAYLSQHQKLPTSSLTQTTPTLHVPSADLAPADACVLFDGLVVGKDDGRKEWESREKRPLRLARAVCQRLMSSQLLGYDDSISTRRGSPRRIRLPSVVSF